MRRRRPDGVLVPPRKPPENIRQRQKQPNRRPHDHIDAEPPAPLEDLRRRRRRRRRRGVAVGGEGEAGEGEEVCGDEGREGEVEEWNEAAGGEDHDKGDELELDDAERAHDAAGCGGLWLLLAVLRGLFWRGEIGVRARTHGEGDSRHFLLLLLLLGSFFFFIVLFLTFGERRG